MDVKVQTMITQLIVLSEQDFSPRTKECMTGELYDILFNLLCSKERSDNLGALADFIKIHVKGEKSKWEKLALDAMEIILVAQDTVYKFIDPKCPLSFYPIPNPMRLEKRQFGPRDLLFTLKKAFCNEELIAKLSVERFKQHPDQSLAFHVWAMGIFSGAWCCLVTDFIDEELGGRQQ